MDRHTRKELEKERLRQAAKESQQLRAEQLIPKNLSREELIKAAKEIDDNRNAKYVRKKPTTEQKQKKQANEIIEAYNQIDKLIQSEEEPIVEKDNDEWDVRIGDVINYFDPELSYEITGYRPLTKDKGLDFDPTPFCEVGRKYVETGSYTDYLKGTVLWRQFWEREKSRCKNGLTIGKYRITGDNYFWLNYYRLLSVLNVQNVQGRDESFPMFINKQYEYFHYIELARVLKKDVCALKSRGVGASEIACSIGANLYTTTKQSRSVYTAKTEVLLQPTLEKTWQELDFLNGETQGGFKHLRMKKDTDMMKKASKVERGTNREYGHMAIIEGIVADKPRKLRGRRVENLIFEESGSFPNLIETYIQSEPLVSLLGRRIGTRYVFGTGGESGPGLAGLSKIFYNPEVFNVLPYKNNYTQDGQVVFTAFFIPAYTMWFGVDNIPGYDHRGVVDEEAAKKYYIDQRKRMSTDPEALIKYKAEYCFTPDEALILEGENRFDQEKLVEQLSNIELHKIVEKPKPASLIWPMKEGHVDRDARPTIDFNDKGKIMIAELPITDDNGIAYNNLYCAGCLTPGEKVITVEGIKNVEDVTLNDKLYSIDGKPVNIINLQCRLKEKEPIYKMKLNNIYRTTTFTAEHPIYCATETKKYHNSTTVKKRNVPYTYYVYDFKFKPIKDVKVGDFVKVPNIYIQEHPIPYHIWDNISIRVDKKINNPFNNPDFWWFIGLMLGDGWCESKAKVCLAFNKKETEYINKAHRIINELFGRSIQLYQESAENGISYYFNSKQLHDFFTENFGKGALNKNIPEWVKFLPKDLKLNLVLGYLASNGCVSEKTESMCFVSISYKLLEDFQDILFSLGIINSVHLLRNESIHYINNRQCNTKKTWQLVVHGEMLNKFKSICPDEYKLRRWKYKKYDVTHTIHRCFFEDESYNYIYIKITGIEQSLYTGPVYNYHCDTSTFMCKYIPTHNCDSIDSDSSTSTGQEDVSNFCIVIYRRQFGTRSPRPVAIYKDRPRDVRVAYDNALKLCQFYNCKALLEATRVSLKTYWQGFNKLNYLRHRPKATANTTTKTNLKQYGVPATQAIIDHQLDLVSDYINDYCDQICFPDLINELIRYSYANKRKFDMVAAFAMALLADEDMHGLVPKQRNQEQINEMAELRYYKNEYGQVQFGSALKNDNYGFFRTESQMPIRGYLSLNF